jgi:hypothetical protein
MRTMIAAAFLALAICACGQQAKEYSAAEAGKHVGETATVTDKITGIHESKTGHIFLNMGGRYPNQLFIGFIPKDSADQFPKAKELDGRTVSITDKIVLYKGKPEIVLDDTSMLKTQ